ncbi:MAG: OmpA family protein [Ignavibacteria bacterium]|nr:OmpA family protein [Ignavibacteria bacterium]
MMGIKKCLAILLLTSAFVVPLKSQWWLGGNLNDVMLTQLGISASVGLINHGASFTLPYAPTCCKEYTAASSIGPSASVFLRQEIIKPLRIQLRGSYIPQNGLFETDETLLLSNSVNGISTHALDVKLGWLGAELLLDLNVAGGFRVIAGMNAGTFLSPTFSQKETLKSPATGTFENGQRVRNESTDIALQDASGLKLGIVGGVGYDIPLTKNHSVVLTPEFLYTVGLKDVVEGANWKTTSIRAGASIAFALNAPEPPLPIEKKQILIVDSVHVVALPSEPYRRVEGFVTSVTDTNVVSDVVWIVTTDSRTDTVHSPALPKINARIAVRSVSSSGAASDVFTMNVSTQFVAEALPILPVIFFDPQAVSLSFRYNQISTPSQFDADAIPARTTAVHREVLNVIGQRMAEQTNSTIRLRGTADPTTENSDCGLATKRAEAVKGYLVRTWGISADRIIVLEGSGQCAPERPTRQPSEEGFSENRRVDIETDDLPLMGPVRKRRFNEARTIDPPQLVFDPAGSSTQYVTDYKITATTEGTVLISDGGKGSPLKKTYDVTIDMAEKLSLGAPVQVNLTLNALQGVTETATAKIQVKKDTLKTEIERLTLTLFNVASDAITPVSEQAIKHFVEDVPAGSTVVVRGFADMLGNADFNKKLSASRAQSVCTAIRKYLTKRVDLQCNEVATDRFPPGIDSYKTPEERFLSRTVQIEIKKDRK